MECRNAAVRLEELCVVACLICCPQSSHFLRFVPADACARELFSASSSYAHVGDPNRARAARAACVCLLAVRQPAEALDYILLAEQLESSGDAPHLSVQTKFLKLKCALLSCALVLSDCCACRIQLEQGTDDEGALAALQALTQCVDFDIDFLYLAALVRYFRTCVSCEPFSHVQRTQESQSKNALRCAQEAYTLLYREVTTSGSVGAAKAAACPGYFAQLLVRARQMCACFICAPHFLPCSVIS